MSVVDADHPEAGVNEMNLAERVLAGDVGAGQALCELMSRKGIGVTWDAVVRVVAGAGVLTPVGFDTACDAFERWTFARLVRDIPVPEDA